MCCRGLAVCQSWGHLHAEAAVTYRAMPIYSAAMTTVQPLTKRGHVHGAHLPRRLSQTVLGLTIS
jgi:hypothetical protein